MLTLAHRIPSLFLPHLSLRLIGWGKCKLKIIVLVCSTNLQRGAPVFPAIGLGSASLKILGLALCTSNWHSAVCFLRSGNYVGASARQIVIDTDVYCHV